MEIDQNWVIENINLMMRVFMKINGPMSKQNKSKHKQNILNNADTISYRAIYVLAKEKKREIKLDREINELSREIRLLKIQLKQARGEPILYEEFKPKRATRSIPSVNLSKDTGPPSS